MRAEEDDAAAAPRQVGDHVRRSNPFRHGGDRDPHPDRPGLRTLRELGAQRGRDHQHGNADAGPDERGGDRRGATRASVVGDEHRAGTARLRVSRLLEHEALTAPKQGDGPVREAVEVRGLTAARRRARLDRRHRRGDVAVARVPQRDEVAPGPEALGVRLDPLEPGRPRLPKPVEGEGLQPRLVPGGAKLANDVRDRPLVAGPADFSRAAAAPRDSVQGPEVRFQARGRDRTRERLRLGRRRPALGCR